ncbi:MAG: amidohydrolase family protein [bacterium]|nr:amidohydrolase family protein [bacterium]
MSNDNGTAPMADLHLHAIKPTGSNVDTGRIVEPWVSSKYRGLSTDEFIYSKPYADSCVLDITRIFREARLPAPPHLIDALHHAVMNPEHPDVLTFLTIGTPACFTMEETIRAMKAFGGYLKVDIIPTTPISLDYRMMAKSLETLTPEAGRYGYRPLVKLHPLIQQFHLGEIPDDVFRVLNEHGALLITHTGVFQGGPCVLQEGILDIDASDPIHMRKYADNYHNIDILLSHMGTPDIIIEKYWFERDKQLNHFLNALQLITDCPNVYGDIGGLMYSAPTEGKYGEEKSEREVDFTPRSKLAFDSIAMRLNNPVRYGEGKIKLREKIVHGSDFR